MIHPVSNDKKESIHSDGGPSVTPLGISSTSSIAASASTSCYSAASWVIKIVLFPLSYVYEFLKDRFALTTYEMDLFADLLEGFFAATVTLAADRGACYEKLAWIDKRCSLLLGRLKNKWFAGQEGIYFTRVNLLTMQARVRSALSDSQGVEACRQELLALGIAPSSDLEWQITALRKLNSLPARAAIFLVNCLLKLAIPFLKRRTPSS